MLRKYILSRYVDLTWVEDILGHSPFIYLRGVFVHCALLFVVFIIYHIAILYISSVKWMEIWLDRTSWIAGFLWLLIFFRRLLWFLNLYLDCILISKDSLSVFLRDWILEYKTEVIDRSKILIISHRQDSLRDKLCWKWDIVIQLWNDIDFAFNDISHPKKATSKLIFNKKNHEEAQKKKIEEDLEWDQRQFDILVDALSEVIKDYMVNKNNEEL